MTWKTILTLNQVDLEMSNGIFLPKLDTNLNFQLGFVCVVNFICDICPYVVDSF
jgi:hypothetical protein